jgi:inorganic pyrophosphatase
MEESCITDTVRARGINNQIYHAGSGTTERKSFWHDESLFYRDTLKIKDIVPEDSLVDQTYQMVVEIEANTRAKMEISKELKFNPIVLDRCLKRPMPFSYGGFPQTYEDPHSIDPVMNIKGDNDPLDVCNMSNIFRNTKGMEHRLHRTGDIIPVKAIGIFQIRDSGEADWKVIAVDYDLFSSYIDSYEEAIGPITDILMEWFSSDPKYEDLIFFDILHPRGDVSGNAINVFNTVMKHSIESYVKRILQNETEYR